MRILDTLVPEPGSICLLDGAFIDYLRLHQLNQARAFFVTRAKKDTRWRRLYSNPVDRSTG